MTTGLLVLVIVAAFLLVVGLAAWWLRRRARWMAGTGPQRRADDGRGPRRAGVEPERIRNSTWMRGGGGGV